MKRILTAVVALPILLFTIWSRNPYYFDVLAVVALSIALGEFYNLAARTGAAPYRLPGYVASLGVLACFVTGRPGWLGIVIALSTCLLLAWSLFSDQEMNTVMASISTTMLGVAYPPLLGGFLIGIRMLPDSAETGNLAARVLTTFFAYVMMADTGAYYVGRSIGRRKLAPRISPGKTVEGLIGGLIVAAATGPVCRALFFNSLPLLHSIILGAIIAIIGPAGDLAESLLKRGSNVKDSSNILPGHGGMLDRLDSALFCAPIMYIYVRLVF